MAYAIVVVLVLIADQLMKNWTSTNLALDVGEKVLIPNILSLTNVHNTGMAFGLLDGQSWLRWALAVVAILFSIFVGVMIANKIIKGVFGRWMAAFVMAGALGNAIDRAAFGFVVDMFRFEFLKSFPVFNIADIFITCGGILFCLYIIFHKDYDQDKKRPPVRQASGGGSGRSPQGGRGGPAPRARRPRSGTPEAEALSVADIESIDKSSITARIPQISPNTARLPQNGPGPGQAKEGRQGQRPHDRQPLQGSGSGAARPPAHAQRPASPPPQAKGAAPASDRRTPAHRPPVKQAASYDVDVPEFTLEDILAEFSDK